MHSTIADMCNRWPASAYHSKSDSFRQGAHRAPVGLTSLQHVEVVSCTYGSRLQVFVVCSCGVGCVSSFVCVSVSACLQACEPACLWV
eukprot:1155218-Alexandrium_andersonii.AAC.1